MKEQAISLMQNGIENDDAGRDLVPRFEWTTEGAMEFAYERTPFIDNSDGYIFYAQSGLPMRVVEGTNTYMEDENCPIFNYCGTPFNVGYHSIILRTNDFEFDMAIMIDSKCRHSDEGGILVTTNSLLDFITGNDNRNDLRFMKWHEEALHLNRKTSPMSDSVLSLTHFTGQVEQILESVDPRHEDFIDHCTILDTSLKLPMGSFQEMFRLLVVAEKTIRSVTHRDQNSLLVQDNPAIAAHFIPESIPLIHYHGFLNNKTCLGHGEFVAVHLADLAKILSVSAKDLMSRLQSWHESPSPYIHLMKQMEVREQFYNYLMYQVMVPCGCENCCLEGVSVTPPECDVLVNVQAIPRLAMEYRYELDRQVYLREVDALRRKTHLLFKVPSTENQEDDQ